MKSDIKLKENGITEIDGRVLEVSCHDIIIDHKDRRGTRNKTKPRRALVHDFQDGLTLNWDNDYPGGVTINNGKIINTVLEGAIEIKDKITAKGGLIIEKPSVLHVKGNTKLEGDCEGKDIRLSGLGFDTVTVGSTRIGNSTSGVDIELPGRPGAALKRPKSIVEVIKQMQQTISKLEKRIQELERR